MIKRLLVGIFILGLAGCTNGSGSADAACAAPSIVAEVSGQTLTVEGYDFFQGCADHFEVDVSDGASGASDNNVSTPQGSAEVTLTQGELTIVIGQALPDAEGRWTLEAPVLQAGIASGPVTIEAPPAPPVDLDLP